MQKVKREGLLLWRPLKASEGQPRDSYIQWGGLVTDTLSEEHEACVLSYTEAASLDMDGIHPPAHDIQTFAIRGPS